MKQKLKSGFTTGTAAAAAAKGALFLLLGKKAPLSVKIEFLSGGFVDIALESCFFEKDELTVCTVKKDAGDDPDVTNKAIIGARVMILDNQNQGKLIITGGQGVGIVTKPGLEISPGQPAINQGPLKMITCAVEDVLNEYQINMPVHVEIFVPEGEKLAKRTLNSRLGILGGISILGTTGIVRPMSHEAYTASIEAALSVAKAVKLDRVVLTTGRRTEKHSQALWDDLPEEAFIQIGDFFKFSMEAASKKNFKSIYLAVFFGKAVKMAQGVPHTHAAKSSLTLHKLSDWSYEVTKDRKFSEEIMAANTARHAFDIIIKEYPEIISHVGKRMTRAAREFASPEVSIHGNIFDYNGNLIFEYYL
ncbi:Cobalt-precorrin-5B C(1)-methyltransferase [Candidatus Magnetomoraceae bacterium gMMP-15]